MVKEKITCKNYCCAYYKDIYYGECSLEIISISETGKCECFVRK